MIGQYVPSLAIDVPEGYIECNGQRITRSEYPKFFEEMRLQADFFDVPNLNQNYTTIGHAGRSTFEFDHPEYGENGEYAYGAACGHSHGKVSIRRYKSMDAWSSAAAADDVGENDVTLGPGYDDSAVVVLPDADASFVGDIYGNDRCILVKYLLGVK